MLLPPSLGEGFFLRFLFHSLFEKINPFPNSFEGQTTHRAAIVPAGGPGRAVVFVGLFSPSCLAFPGPNPNSPRPLGFLRMGFFPPFLKDLPNSPQKLLYLPLDGFFVGHFRVRQSFFSNRKPKKFSPQRQDTLRILFPADEKLSKSPLRDGIKKFYGFYNVPNKPLFSPKLRPFCP